MKFEKIVNVNSRKFRDVWEVYEHSFPRDEKRTFEDQIKIMPKKSHALFYVSDRKFLGIMETWDLNNAVLIEHFAVKENLRNRGFGTKIISTYIRKSKKTIVLETEKPVRHVQKRRINFWKRLGFHLNKHDYIQPAYDETKKPVKMFLMSYPKPINKKCFFKIRNDTHKTVYGLEKPLMKI